MIVSWALIGIIVGLLLGLTGAGGAVIAIPLFVHLTGASLRDATVLSLAAVMSGAVLNWTIQKKNTNFRTGSLLFLFSVVGSYTFKPLKASAPEWIILTLFIGVGVLSLISVWKNNGKSAIPHKGAASSKDFIKSLAGGFSLGALVTMTGLGGGVILVPLLTGPFGMPLSQAAATSLYTIILSAASSLVLQWTLVSKDISIPHLLVLAAGSAVSALITKRLLLSVSPSRMDQVRKIVISVVILISIISLTIHSAQAKERNIDMSTRSIHMTELCVVVLRDPQSAHRPKESSEHSVPYVACPFERLGWAR